MGRKELKSGLWAGNQWCQTHLRYPCFSGARRLRQHHEPCAWTCPLQIFPKEMYTLPPQDTDKLMAPHHQPRPVCHDRSYSRQPAQWHQMPAATLKRQLQCEQASRLEKLELLAQQLEAPTALPAEGGAPAAHGMPSSLSERLQEDNVGLRSPKTLSIRHCLPFKIFLFNFLIRIEVQYSFK